jgi:hypothetical protein
MKHRYFAFLILSSFLFNSCSNIDLSPDYSGRYVTSFKAEQYKNGKLLGRDEQSGIMTVSHRPGEKTVFIDAIKGPDGQPLEMKIKLGSFSKKLTESNNGCTTDDEVNGKLDDLFMNINITKLQTCGSDITNTTFVVTGTKMK